MGKVENSIDPSESAEFLARFAQNVNPDSSFLSRSSISFTDAFIQH